MEQIFQSGILQALGWAIADSVWQMALLWLLYQLVIGLPFRNNPFLKHLGATVALFAGGLWFVGNTAYKILINSGKGVAGIGRIDPTLTNWMESLLPYLSTAYLVILVLLMSRFIHSIILTQRLRITENQPAAHWQEFVDSMALRFFIARKVFVQISDAVSVPATIGFLKPVILLPLASVNSLSITQVEAIIMHELAHIRRNDYLLNLIASFIETILFFNPFAHLLSSLMRRECELCCDDAVLSQKQDPGQYAYALLMLEKSRQQLPLAMAATGKESLLLGRVKRILNQPEQQVKYRHKLLALVLVAGLIMGLSFLNPSSRKNSEAPTHNAGITASTELINGRPGLPMMMKVQSDDRSVVHNNQPAMAKAPKAPAGQRSAVIDPMPPPPPHPAPPVPPAPTASLILERKAGEINLPEMININEPALLALKGLDEKEIGEFMEHFNNGKFIIDIEGKMDEVMEQSVHIQRLIEAERRFNVEQRRMSIDMQRRDEQMKRMNQEQMRIIFPKKPASPRSKVNTEKEIQTTESEVFYKALAAVSPKVRTFKDENGTTISIIEEDTQIRIHFSSK